MSHWETPGASDEWFTPRFVFDALGTAFDLDVAAPVNGGDHVPAALRYCRRGLTEEWFGFVWMNPPFGGRNSLAPWMARFFAHGNGIALTPDRTSAPWFQQAWRRADMVLFTRKIRFLRPDGTEGKSPSNGTALWAAGERGCRCLIRAADDGLCILARPLNLGPCLNTSQDALSNCAECNAWISSYETCLHMPSRRPDSQAIRPVAVGVPHANGDTL